MNVLTMVNTRLATSEMLILETRKFGMNKVANRNKTAYRKILLNHFINDITFFHKNKNRHLYQLVIHK